jgi:hypothetical protein
MITSILMGGMGNQMYQYAMGLAQATRLGVPLQIDATRLGGNRPFSLTQWTLPSLTTTTRLQPTVQEHGMAYNPYMFDVIKDEDVLQGYWQSEKWFANLPPDFLRNMFVPSFPLSERAEKLRAQITGHSDSCFIHVRRGDYLREPHKSFHGILSGDYYSEAVKQVYRDAPEAQFFLFSDDGEWLDNAGVLPCATRVKPGREAEDIYLMSLCKHAIIANSSFSWWGAWLGDKQPNRTVIAPQKWFTDEAKQDYSDIVPGRWIKI